MKITGKNTDLFYCCQQYWRTLPLPIKIWLKEGTSCLLSTHKSLTSNGKRIQTGNASLILHFEILILHQGWGFFWGKWKHLGNDIAYVPQNSSPHSKTVPDYDKSCQTITSHVLNEINVAVMKSRTFSVSKPLLIWKRTLYFEGWLQQKKHFC